MLQLCEVIAPEPGVRYPKLLERRGDPPPQYVYEDEVDD